MIIRLILAVALALVWAEAALGQTSLVGTYEMEWAILHVPVSSDLPDLLTGTTTIEVQSPPNGAACPPTSVYMIEKAPAAAPFLTTTTWCLLADGSFDTSAGGNSGGVSLYTSDIFYVQAESRRGNDTIVAVGRRAQNPPPPPPPSPVKVFITQPKAGATISGTVWVVVWAEGTTGSSNVFTLSVDGKVIQSVTSSSRGPITMPWYTINNPNALNGAHTLGASVRDSTGTSGSTSITVIVNN